MFVVLFAIFSPVLANPDLLKAAAEGNMELARKLMEEGADANFSEENTGEFTPLMRAAAYDRVEMAKFLIEKGARTDLRDGIFENTALHTALKHGSDGVAALLSERRFENTANVYGENLLHLACERNKPECVKLALKILKRSSAEEKNWRDSSGDTPLHKAMKSGHVRTVICMLHWRMGMDVAAPGEGEKTPLHLACARGKAFEHVAVYLMEVYRVRGFNVNAEDEDGWTPLFHALHAGSVKALRKMLFDDYFDVRVTLSVDYMGRNPLHVLCNEAATYVEKLSDMGADMEESDVFGCTPLLKALERGDVAVAWSLIKKGADLEAVTEKENTTLHAASCSDNNRDVIKLLLDHVDVNAKNADGESSLNIAASSGAVEIVEMLLENGADVNNNEEGGGIPPLFSASMADDEDKSRAITDMLLNEGAKIGTVLLNNVARHNPRKAEILRENFEEVPSRRENVSPR